MVFSLSVPGFPKTNNSNTNQQADENTNSSNAPTPTNNPNMKKNNSPRRGVHRLSIPTPNVGRNTRKPTITGGVLGSSTGNQQQSSSTITNASTNPLTEALRTPLPFTFVSPSRTRSTTTTTANTTAKDHNQHHQQAHARLDEQRREQEELNNALEILARVFPDVKVEVFREMLARFDGESRVEVCVEQLLRFKGEWVAGRWNTDQRIGGQDEDGHTGAKAGIGSEAEGGLIPIEERFRTHEYKAAVRTTLGKEFTSLSRSTIDAVLAEVNFSYARARPTLRDLSRKTWRATFNNLFPSFKRKKDRDRDDHPLLVWQQGRRGDGEIPRLKETGCAELDNELHDALLAPLIRQRREEQEGRDFQLAEQLNESEARDAEAIYECECCLADVTFEQISTCDDPESSHIICYACIQRTVSEALFGQGWNKSVDVAKSTLRCLAPLSQGSCEGSLHPQIVKRAILLDKAGFETHAKFEDRLASEALLKSQYKLIRCPFCSYAEVDPVYHPSVRGVQWRFRQDATLPTVLVTMLLLDLLCLLALPTLILYVHDPTSIRAMLHNSLLNLCLKTRPKRFTCAHPTCRRTSCIICQKPWRDPHVCHEPLLLDLRATVEAARTAAVKRTCPRCGLSFVKSSGCNKLTCVCGYSMCYLCRKALNPPVGPDPYNPVRRRPHRRQNNNQENVNPNDELQEEHEEDEEQPEGYRHFCEHFRINPGSRCTECSKCDLYQAEDEDAVARRAGEQAEREWRVRQGMLNQPGAVGGGVGGGVGVGVGVVPGVGSRNVNNELSAENKKQSAGYGWGWWWLSGLCDANWKYWLVDMWCDGGWKIEAQEFVDWVVEWIVVVEEV